MSLKIGFFPINYSCLHLGSNNLIWVFTSVLAHESFQSELILGIFMILRSSTTYKKKMVVAGNGLFYPIIGFASCLAFIYMSFGDLRLNFHEEAQLPFVKRNGTQFTLEGKPFYINGWNSYWLMYHGADEYTRPRVREMLQAGAKMGLTLCRTWAFNDGDYNALQVSPGQFDERVFKVYIFILSS